MNLSTLVNVTRGRCSLASFIVGLAGLLLCSLTTSVIAQSSTEAESLIEISNSDPNAKWQARASHNRPNGQSPASNAVDDVPTNRWTSGAKQKVGMWFELDLRSPQSVDRMVLTAPVDPAQHPKKPGYVKALDFPKSYEVFVSSISLSDDEWAALTPVANGGNSMTASDALALRPDGVEKAKRTIIDFDEQQKGVEFIRIYLTGNEPDDHYWWSIMGIQLFTETSVGNDQDKDSIAEIDVTRELPALHVCAAQVKELSPLTGKEGWSASTTMVVDDDMRKFGMTDERWETLPENAIDTRNTTDRDSKKTRWTSYKAQAPGMDFAIKFGNQSLDFNRIQLTTSFNDNPNSNGKTSQSGDNTDQPYFTNMDHPRHFKVTLTDISGTEIDSLEWTDDMADEVTDICFDGVQSAHQVTVTLLAEPEGMANPSDNHYWWSIHDVNLYQVTADDLPASIPEQLVCPAGYYVEKVTTKGESGFFAELAMECVSMSDANDSNTVTASQVNDGAQLLIAPQIFTANDAALTNPNPQGSVLASCDDLSKRVTGLALQYQMENQAYDEVTAICEQHIEPLDCTSSNRVGSVLVLDPTADRRFAGASVECISSPEEGALLKTTVTMKSEQYDGVFAVPHSTYTANGASLTNDNGKSLVSCATGETVTGVALRYDERLDLYVAEDPKCVRFSSNLSEESIPSVPRTMPDRGVRLRQCDAYTHMYIQHGGKSIYLEGDRPLIKSIGQAGHPNPARSRARDAIEDCMKGWVEDGKKPTEMGACNNEGVWNSNGVWEQGTTKIDRRDVLDKDLESTYGDKTFVEFLAENLKFEGGLAELCSPEAADFVFDGPNQDTFTVRTNTFVSNRGKSFYIPTTAQIWPVIGDGACANNYSYSKTLTVAQLCGSRDSDSDGILDSDEFPGCENDKNADCAEKRGLVIEGPFNFNLNPVPNDNSPVIEVDINSQGFDGALNGAPIVVTRTREAAASCADETLVEQLKIELLNNSEAVIQQETIEWPACSTEVTAAVARFGSLPETTATVRVTNLSGAATTGSVLTDVRVLPSNLLDNTHQEQIFGLTDASGIADWTPAADQHGANTAFRVNDNLVGRNVKREVTIEIEPLVGDDYLDGSPPLAAQIWLKTDSCSSARASLGTELLDSTGLVLGYKSWTLDDQIASCASGIWGLVSVEWSDYPTEVTTVRLIVEASTGIQVSEVYLGIMPPSRYEELITNSNGSRARYLKGTTTLCGGYNQPPCFTRSPIWKVYRNHIGAGAIAGCSWGAVAASPTGPGSGPACLFAGGIGAVGGFFTGSLTVSYDLVTGKQVTACNVPDLFVNDLDVCTCGDGKFWESTNNLCLPTSGLYLKVRSAKNFYDKVSVKKTSYTLLKNPNSLTDVHGWGLEQLKNANNGTCFVGVVDDQTGITYIHPSGKAGGGVLSRTFTCPSFSVKTNARTTQAVPRAGYDTRPITRNSTRAQTPHGNLMLRVIPNLEDLYSNYELHRGVGFFLQKHSSNSVSIDFTTRTLHLPKFSYNGISRYNDQGALDGEVYHLQVCGTYPGMDGPVSPRCFPTKDWACHISDGIAKGLGVTNLVEFCN